MSSPSFETMLVNYLLAVLSQHSAINDQRLVPDFVPSRIRTDLKTAAYVSCGEHDCETTLWGCIVLTLPAGKRVGVYVYECEILELKPNAKKQAWLDRAELGS